MITSIKANNIGMYKALFDEASDILRGYKRVRTYDKNKKYYYKVSNTVSFENMFEELEITSMEDFSNKFNEHQKVLYVKIFDADKISPTFNPSSNISTLEEYFAHLKTLTQIEEVGAKYSVLPLDEDPFEINADTRVINIPNSFKKNGIAIQGDDQAEVLYFKIDRYFDYMDFNNCDILIQWENSKGEKNASPAYICDIETDPGKLIFGWILDKNITAHSGPLKFSVRFIQWANKDEINQGNRTVTYSFSTLTASVTVHPCLNVNLDDIGEINIDNLKDSLLNRIENSEIVGGHMAATPEFYVNLLDEEYDYGFSKIENGKEVFDGSLLKALAIAPDTGSIAYYWKKQNLDNENNPTGDYKYLTNENIAVEVDKTQPLDSKLIYFLNKDMTIQLRDYEISEEDKNDPDYHIYTPYGGYTITQTDNEDVSGVYWVTATNRITNSSTPKDSLRVKFSRPDDIVITKGLGSAGILAGEEESWECQLSIEVEEADSQIQKKSYIWYKDGNELTSEKKSTYTATEPGYYNVEITNTRNGATKKFMPALDVRVTYPAKEPYVILSPVKNYYVSELDENYCPYVDLTNYKTEEGYHDVESDGFIVKWYHIEKGISTLIATSKKLVPGVDELISKFNPKDYQDRIVEVSEDDNIEGNYYAIVKNYLNCLDEEKEMPANSVFTTEQPDIDNMFHISY